MFSAKVLAIGGSKLQADITVGYFDDRKIPWDLVKTVIYNDVDLSTTAKQADFVNNVIKPQLATIKADEEDQQLQNFVGRVVANV